MLSRVVLGSVYLQAAGPFVEAMAVGMMIRLAFKLWLTSCI